MEQVIYSFLIPLAVGIVIALFTEELYGVVKKLTRFIVLQGANHVSETRRPRYIEECLAELDHIPGPFSKFWNALGMYKAARSGLCFPEDALASAKQETHNSAADPEAVALYSAEILSELRDLASGAGHTYAAYLIQVAVEEMKMNASPKRDQATDVQLKLPLE